MKKYTVFVLGLVFILTLVGCSTRQGEMRPATAPMVTINGNTMEADIGEKVKELEIYVSLYFCT